MRNFKFVVLFVSMSVQAFAFERLALVDSFDYARSHAIESDAGIARAARYVAETGSSALLLRNQSGAVPRYRSAEETFPQKAPGLDKRRVPWNYPVYGWIRLDKGETDHFSTFFREAKSCGLKTGVHFTLEENHYHSFSMGAWNLEHPQYWCRLQGGAPWSGKASLGYDEVLQHKLRLVEELLDRGCDYFYLGTERRGTWGPRWEYTDKMCSEWRGRYGCEPPTDPKDPRWLELVAKYMTRFIREIHRLCHSGGRNVTFILGMAQFDCEGDFQLEEVGLDWKAVAAEKSADALAISDVNWKRVSAVADVWAETERIYRHLKEHSNDLAVYLPFKQYGGDDGGGYPAYAKLLGVKPEVAAARQYALAKKCGARGVILECVDYCNYSPTVCDIMREGADK